MTTNRQVGSKLANSVRQAKEQQTQQAEQTTEPKKATAAAATAKSSPTAKKEESVPYLMPSKRVWPD